MLWFTASVVVYCWCCGLLLVLRFIASGVGFTASVVVSCFVLVRFIPSVVVYC